MTARRRGAPTHTHSRKGRPDRKPTPWPAGTDLKTREGLDAFLCTLIQATWEKNPLDPRTVGSINNSTRLLLESRGWIQKTPLQIIQAQTVIKTEADWQKVFEQTPEEDRLVVAKFIKRLEGGTLSSNQT